MNLRRLAIIPVAFLLLIAFSSCVGVASPTGWAPVAFDGNTAYLMTSKGKLSAVELDGDTGTARWTFPDKDRDEDDKFQTRAIYGSPVLDDDRLYLATFSGGVFALNKSDGRPIWPTSEGNQGRFDGDIAGGLAEDDENIYFGTTEGEFHAWKKSDGTPAVGWEEPKSLGSGGIWATPIVRDGTVYIATMDGELFAFSTESGSERWPAFDAVGAIADLSAVGEDLLFVPTITHQAYFVRMSDGQKVSEFEASDWVWTGAASNGSMVYFGDFAGKVHGLDITTAAAKQVWEASVEGERVRSGPALIGDILIVADRDPTVTFFNVHTGEYLNRVPLSDAGTVRANLVVKDGAAYFATTNGKLWRAEPEGKKVVEIILSGVKK